jgi:DNA-binding NtrC family response regulator
VCSARDKREAETVLTKEECEDLDLLLCDAILPDGFGLDVYKTTLAQYPDLKVVFCSGYTEEIIQVTALRDLGFSFLQKPFTVDRLLETVRETIESGPDL